MRLALEEIFRQAARMNPLLWDLLNMSPLSIEHIVRGVDGLRLGRQGSAMPKILPFAPIFWDSSGAAICCLIAVQKASTEASKTMAPPEAIHLGPSVCSFWW